jgi:hypothetical protein
MEHIFEQYKPFFDNITQISEKGENKDVKNEKNIFGITQNGNVSDNIFNNIKNMLIILRNTCHPDKS